jgi:hypothetical protein
MSDFSSERPYKISPSPDLEPLLIVLMVEAARASEKLANCY